VAVGVQRDLDVGVAEPLADDLGRDAGGQRRGRVAVPDVVQADRRQADSCVSALLPDDPLGVALEPVGDQVRM
jgi:hypothetical protein